MPGFGFDTLALFVVVGLAGPLLASVPHLRVPVVIGELLIGIAIGRTGLGIVDDTDPIWVRLVRESMVTGQGEAIRRKPDLSVRWF